MRKLILAIVLLTMSCSAAYAVNFDYWVLDIHSINGGNTVKVAKFAKSWGISRLIVRTHRPHENGWTPSNAEFCSLCPEKAFISLIRECHKRGIEVYAWIYVYGGPTLNLEYRMAKQAIDTGPDGLVLNAEKEFTQQDRYDDGLWLCYKIREHINARIAKGKPACILDYSTYARSDRGLGEDFPYAVFNRYSDHVRLQAYHKDFGWTPEETVDDTNTNFRNKYKKWYRQTELTDHKFRARIPWILTGQAYIGIRGTKRISPKEFTKFIEANIAAGLDTIDVYSGDRHSTELLKIVKKYSTIPAAKKDPYAGLLNVDGYKTAKVPNLVPEVEPGDDPGPEIQAKSVPVVTVTEAPKVKAEPIGWYTAWRSCAHGQIPWYSAWISDYWKVMFALGTLIGLVFAPFDWRRRARRTGYGIGLSVALLWPWLLSGICIVVAWIVGIIALAITLAILVGVGYLIYYVYRVSKKTPDRPQSR